MKKKISRKPVRKTKKKALSPPAKKLPKTLNKKDAAFFKQLILKRKQEILDQIKHISDDTLKKSQREAAGDISGYTYHMADVATDTYDREFSLGLASNEREILYELDDALKKIEEGKFGICEECKGPISKVRMKALPYARMCVKCQERKEKR